MNYSKRQCVRSEMLSRFFKIGSYQARSIDMVDAHAQVLRDLLLSLIHLLESMSFSQNQFFILILAGECKSQKCKRQHQLEWHDCQDMPLTEDADSAEFNQHQHHKVNLLNLNIQVVYLSGPGSADFEFKVLCNPGTAYAYLPCSPYQSRYILRGLPKPRCTGC